MYLYLFWKLIARSLWSFGRREPISAQELHPSSENTRELSSSLVDFFVTFTSRACNRVAHVLAKQVSGDNRLGEWQLAPTRVVHMLASDCNPDWSMNEIAKSQKKTSPSSGQRDARRSHHTPSWWRSNRGTSA